MADVAWSSFLYTLSPVPAFVRAIFRLKHFYSECLKRYASLADVDEERIELWKTPVLAVRIIEERSKARKRFLLGLVEERLKREIKS